MNVQLSGCPYQCLKWVSVPNDVSISALEASAPQHMGDC